MKSKQWSVLLCGLLLLSGCAGGGGNAAKPPYEPTTTAQALLDSGAFSDGLETLALDLVSSLYGLDQEPTEAAVYTSTGATAEEIAVLSMPDEESAKAALESLKTRVSDQKDASKDYRPAEIPKLDAAILEQRGSTVLLVVASDAAKAQTALDSLG